jgi:GT2 family glycosyltransferase
MELIGSFRKKHEGVRYEANGMDLSIIIVSWNTREYLRACLNSIRRGTGTINYEIIVVDNASSDGSTEMVQGEFPEMTLIINQTNIGFARASNQGLSNAAGRFVLLLNSDTLIIADALSRMCAHMEGHREVGALTVKLLNEDLTVQHPCYLDFPSLLSELLAIPPLNKVFKGYNCYGQYARAGEKEQEVAHATGACLLISREALNKVGCLDEDLVFSYEDADICRRIKMAGYKIIYFPEAEVIHYGGQSVKYLDDQGTDMIMKSKCHYFRKYYGLVGLLVLITVLALGVLWRILIYSFLTHVVRKKDIAALLYNNKLTLEWLMLHSHGNMAVKIRGNQ